MKQVAGFYLHVPPKRQLTLNGLHGVISQKAELFMTTGVRTSNPSFGKLSLTRLRRQ
jgi:hypothetical protein